MYLLYVIVCMGVNGLCIEVVLNVGGVVCLVWCVVDLVVVVDEVCVCMFEGGVVLMLFGVLSFD